MAKAATTHKAPISLQQLQKDSKRYKREYNATHPDAPITLPQAQDHEAQRHGFKNYFHAKRVLEKREMKAGLQQITFSPDFDGERHGFAARGTDVVFLSDGDEVVAVPAPRAPAGRVAAALNAAARGALSEPFGPSICNLTDLATAIAGEWFDDEEREWIEVQDYVADGGAPLTFELVDDGEGNSDGIALIAEDDQGNCRVRAELRYCFSYWEFVDAVARIRQFAQPVRGTPLRSLSELARELDPRHADGMDSVEVIEQSVALNRTRKVRLVLPAAAEEERDDLPDLRLEAMTDGSVQPVRVDLFFPFFLDQFEQALALAGTMAEARLTH